MSKIFIECDCYSEGLAINEDVSDGYIEISYWKYGIDSGKLTIWSRLRHIWNIIKYGHPNTDMILLDSDKARVISNKLSELADKLQLQQKIKEKCY